MDCQEFCSSFSCLLGWLDRHAQSVIALLAFVVSLVALSGSSKQALQQQEFNRLSVKPMLEPRVERKLGPDPTVGMWRGRVACILSNVGLGPATLVGVKGWFEGAEYNVGDATEIERRLRAFLAKFNVRRVEGLNTFTFAKRSGLPREGQINLLEVTVLVPTEDDFYQMEHALRSSVRLVIDYQSAYGDRQVFDTDEYGEAVLPERLRSSTPQS